MIDLTITPETLTFSPNNEEIEKEYDQDSNYDFHELIEYYLCNGLMTIETKNVTNWLNNVHILLSDGERVYYLPEYAVIDEVEELLIKRNPIIFRYLCDFEEQFLEDDASLTVAELRPVSIEPVVPRILLDDLGLDIPPIPPSLDLILPTFPGTNRFEKDCQCLTGETNYGMAVIAVEWMMTLPELTEEELSKAEKVMKKASKEFYSDDSDLTYNIINKADDIKKLSRKWQEFRFWDINK